jgi:hypothetical protein
MATPTVAKVSDAVRRCGSSPASNAVIVDRDGMAQPLLLLKIAALVVARVAARV